MVATHRPNGYPRVAITGMSVISPVGIGLETFWSALINGTSGIRRIQAFDPSHLRVQIAGEVLDFDPTPYLSAKKQRQLERVSQFAAVGTHMAIKDAKLEENTLRQESERIGVAIGTAFGGYDAMQRGVQDFMNGKRPSAFALVASLTNMPTFYAAEAGFATGHHLSITTACAASTQAIGEGYEMIRRGRAEIAIVGGVESLITDYTIACFDSMTSLPRNYNDNPSAASRPFDADREGFVFSEGGAILILESFEHALARDARIYAEIVGYASSDDIYHITSIDPKGKGIERAMRWALQDAQINPEQIDYINAHGTSTRTNDPIETAAIKRVIGRHAPVNSTKSMIGHALGAAGALEAVVCVLSIRDQMLHPTINYTTPDPDCDLDYVPNEARSAKIDYALSNSLGLGGHNASLIIAKV
ncbi:MAG: beta-ketoacyl-[acyl-carrier-protein] synthase II [Phototrophicales bacterium]|nr:MAG: beta-ketoacyl-[acyl-carrier-protein] synthase II [Phototrophicales bacterium]